MRKVTGKGWCWIRVDLVDIQGEISGLPVLTAPPPPVTDTPEPTITPTEEEDQPAYSSCGDYPDLATCNDDPVGFGNCIWDTGTNNCRQQ